MLLQGEADMRDLESNEGLIGVLGTECFDAENAGGSTKAKHLFIQGIDSVVQTV